ncbi:MAG: hypothetical protein ACREIA_22895, partial [Opitutaceae bacterium]
MNQKPSAVAADIALQSWLRPELTPVGPNKDYAQLRELIEDMDGLLRGSHLEAMALDFAVEGFETASVRQLRRRKDFALKALRVEILRTLLGNPSFREFSRTIASSDLLAGFCGVLRLDGIKGIAKSTLERASKFFRGEQLRWMHQVLVEMSAEPDRAAELGLEAALPADICLIDSTCLEANIHYPVDWVLLRDVSTTLLKATRLIRGAGLLARMPCEPDAFARRMNRLCLEMTHTRRRADARRSRKRVLREMKHLLRVIGGHARRHRDRLEAGYSSTEYSQAQAARIIGRIDAMLEALPQVIDQAHERIIGGRQAPSKEKILSVHETDIHVL